MKPFIYHNSVVLIIGVNEELGGIDVFDVNTEKSINVIYHDLEPCSPIQFAKYRLTGKL